MESEGRSTQDKHLWGSKDYRPGQREMKSWRQRYDAATTEALALKGALDLFYLKSRWPGHYTFDSDTGCPQGVCMTLG